MNTVEDNLKNNANDFKPTKELGDLAKYAAMNAFGVKKDVGFSKEIHLSR